VPKKRKDRVEECPRKERIEWKSAQEKKGQSGRMPDDRRKAVAKVYSFDEKSEADEQQQEVDEQ